MQIPVVKLSATSSTAAAFGGWHYYLLKGKHGGIVLYSIVPPSQLYSSDYLDHPRKKRKKTGAPMLAHA